MNEERLTGEQEIALIRDLRSYNSNPNYEFMQYKNESNELTTSQTSKPAGRVKGSVLHKRVLDKLVLANLGLCHKVVQKFPLRTVTCTYDDLLHEAIAGLIYGIGKFDPTRGYRLSTYVYPWVRNYVQRYYQNHGKTIRIPVNLTEKHIKLNKQLERMTHILGRDPEPEEVREINKDADRIMGAMMNTASLNEMMSENSELECLVGEDPTPVTEQTVEVEMLLSKLKELVSERDYDMFVLRYGLSGHSPYTLQELSDRFELTRARVHQIEHGILTKLRSLV